MGISDADTAKNPWCFRFVYKKTAHFANACIRGSHCSMYLLMTSHWIHHMRRN